MIDEKEFRGMRKELEAYDRKREELIIQSRVLLKLSKQLIYSVQRNDIKDAEKLLIKAINEKSALDQIAFSMQRLEYEGSYSEACQEYVEAVTILEFEKGKKMSTAKNLKVSTGDYLMGIADLTGELVRLAIRSIIAGKYDSAGKIRNHVDIIWGEFLKFDFRNSKIRRKFDSIKYNLAKLDDLMCEIKLKR